MTLSTPQGDLHFHEPDAARLASLRGILPFGGLAFAPDVRGAQGARFGIVMKCGDEEAWCIKQQSPDIPETGLKAAWMANSLLIALSIQRYVSFGFGGCLMPCAYSRSKGDQTEAGIAYFGAPRLSGTEAQEFPFDEAFDNQFGHGFTTMVTHFIRSLQASSRDSGITLQPCIGMDHRPRSLLETLGFGLLVHGRDVYSLKTLVTEIDPLWTALRATGITDLYQLPSLPIEIGEDQLGLAKPQPQS